MEQNEAADLFLVFRSEKCIKFYKNKRPIRTASDTQVRKSIYKSSINIWKNYENNFSNVKHILNKWAKKFNYS